jgi:hypothetical protein
MLKEVDLSDGFYRIVWLRSSDHVPILGVAFPALPDEEPLVASPLVFLPMGWCESPPYFCALTETVTDLTNECIAAHWDPRPHPLEALASTPPNPLPGYTATNLLSPSCRPAQSSFSPHREAHLAIPGGSCGMFSLLQLALCHSDCTRIHLTQPVRDQIEDFWSRQSKKAFP